MALGWLALAEDQPVVFKWHVLLINKGELTLPNWNLCQTHLFLHHFLLPALKHLSEALWLKDWVCCVVCAILMAWGFWFLGVLHPSCSALTLTLCFALVWTCESRQPDLQAPLLKSAFFKAAQMSVLLVTGYLRQPKKWAQYAHHLKLIIFIAIQVIA